MSKALGKVLYFLRKQQNITQKTIADQLKIDRSSYSNYERGVTEPDSRSLKKLAKIFDVSVDYLLTGVGEDQKVADVTALEFDREMQVGLLSKDEHEMLVRYRLLEKEYKEEIKKEMDTIIEKNEKMGKI